MPQPLEAAVEHLGVTGQDDRREPPITHNFVIDWLFATCLTHPSGVWIGLNRANCAITIVQLDFKRPPTLTTFNDTAHLWPHPAGQHAGGQRGVAMNSDFPSLAERTLSAGSSFHRRRVRM
jgi:hypothetical protein